MYVYLPPPIVSFFVFLIFNVVMIFMILYILSHIICFNVL